LVRAHGLRPLLPETWTLPPDALRKKMARDELDHHPLFYSKRLKHWLHERSQMRPLRLGLEIYPAAERITFIRKQLTAFGLPVEDDIAMRRMAGPKVTQLGPSVPRCQIANRGFRMAGDSCSLISSDVRKTIRRLRAT
jgi:hypothetical protein